MLIHNGGNKQVVWHLSMMHNRLGGGPKTIPSFLYQMNFMLLSHTCLLLSHACHVHVCHMYSIQGAIYLIILFMFLVYKHNLFPLTHFEDLILNKFTFVLEFAKLWKLFIYFLHGKLKIE
jgi:hypothetical protein